MLDTEGKVNSFDRRALVFVGDGAINTKEQVDVRTSARFIRKCLFYFLHI